MDLILPSIEIQNGTWLDARIDKAENLKLRYWHVIFMAFGVFLSVGEYWKDKKLQKNL